MRKIIHTIMFLSFTGGSFAASFDCTKASTLHEKAICDTPTLSALDDELSATYINLRSVTSDPAQLKSEQIEWIKEARKCQSDTSCIERQYTTRLIALNSQLPQRVLPPSPTPLATSSMVSEQPANSNQPALNKPDAIATLPIASSTEPMVASVPSVKKKDVESNFITFFVPLVMEFGLVFGISLFVLFVVYFIFKKIISFSKRAAAKTMQLSSQGKDASINSLNDFKKVVPHENIAKERVKGIMSTLNEKIKIAFNAYIELFKGSPWLVGFVTFFIVILIVASIENTIRDYTDVSSQGTTSYDNSEYGEAAWRSKCQIYARKRDECATANNVTQCLEIKLGAGDAYLAAINCSGSVPNPIVFGPKR
jgi:uncharacterized protein